MAKKMLPLLLWVVLVSIKFVDGQQSWPKDFTNADVQEGYVMGMATELQGLWLGDEKYMEEDGTVNPYCSRAIFHPDGYLTWEGTNSTCKDVNINQKFGTVKGNWFEKVQLPSYLLKIRQRRCLPADMCDVDVTKRSSRDKGDIVYGGWNLEAKACGESLKDDFLYEETYSCEQYQVSLISKTLEGKMHYKIVSTLSYKYFYDGWENANCTSKPSFKADSIADIYEGSARFVLQSGFETDLTNPCNWDCFDDEGGKFNCTS